MKLEFVLKLVVQTILFKVEGLFNTEDNGTHTVSWLTADRQTEIRAEQAKGLNPENSSIRTFIDNTTFACLLELII